MGLTQHKLWQRAHSVPGSRIRCLPQLGVLARIRPSTNAHQTKIKTRPPKPPKQASACPNDQPNELNPAASTRTAQTSAELPRTLPTTLPHMLPHMLPSHAAPACCPRMLPSHAALACCPRMLPSHAVSRFNARNKLDESWNENNSQNGSPKTQSGSPKSNSSDTGTTTRQNDG
jgi:hypothetical protein